MVKKLLFGFLVITSLGLGGYFGALQFRVTDQPPDLASLSNIKLPDVEKNLRSGGEWLGKIVVVNHWATWCGPCREEIPMLIEFQEKMQHKGVQIVGIAHDRLEPVRIFGDEIGMTYPSLVAIVDGNKILESHGNTRSGALPFTAVFDQNGEIVRTKLGLLSQSELESMVLPLLP